VKPIKLVYLAGPITRGPIVGNVAQADRAMFRLMRAGFGVVNPMLTCWAGAGDLLERTGGDRAKPRPQAHGDFELLTHAEWVTNCLPIVERVDAVLRLPGESTGADMETEHARKFGIPVFETVEGIEKWNSSKS
jgi:hypothetical protein